MEKNHPAGLFTALATQTTLEVASDPLPQPKESSMHAPLDRRSFLKHTSAWTAGISLAAWHGLSSPLAAAASKTPHCEKLGWQLCAQLYTFRRFSFYEALEMIDGLGLKHVEPCFFLRLDKDRPDLKTGETLTPKLRGELKQKLAQRGIQMTNYYADLGADEAAARKTFTFAKEMGVQTIVSEPPAEAFAMIETLCNEFEINLAVHNHPKSPNSKYWQPENVLKVCERRGKRIGACCDTGHWVRSGLKPIECLKKMEGRIITLHLKDVGEWGKPEARDVPLGTGLGDYAAVLKELRGQQFRGVLAIEYEHDSPQLVDDVAACIAFVEKTAGTLA
jgi:sugar phosphate isomerase/epimerase